MPYPADYRDAHERHWDDAECLFDVGRWPNADHLYGLSAECGLKAAMESLRLEVDPQGRLERRHWMHVNDLWTRFRTFAQGTAGRWFLNALPNGDPFSNWSIQNRYAHRRHFAEGDVAAYRHAAGVVRTMIRRAEQDGRI